MKLQVTDLPADQELEVEVNGVQCIECDEMFEAHPNHVSDIECQNYPDHAAEPYHVTDKPLGLEIDEDVYHFGRLRYEYRLEEAW